MDFINDKQVNKYLELLNAQGFSKDSNELKSLIELLDVMDERYNSILSELQDVKKTLYNIQNPQIKTLASKAVDVIERRVEHGKGQIENMKVFIKQVANDTLTSFKETGKQALVSSIERLKIKPFICKVHKSLYFSLNEVKVAIQKVDHMTTEVRHAKNHFKNFSSLLFGKRMPQYPHDKNNLNITQRMLRSISTKLESSITKTSKLLHNLDDLEKSSVKNDLRLLGNKGANKDKVISTPTIEQKSSR